VNALDITLVILLVLSAMATIMTARLLRAVIGLAITSAVLTVIMFRLAAPLAAVFELSVCAGLIPAIFISAIGLTRRIGAEELPARQQERWRRFWPLPVLLGLVIIVLTQWPLPITLPQPQGPEQVSDVSTLLWNTRPADLLAQVALLLAGAFAVVMLVKNMGREHE
jgi:NADH-quinone oxidoreductase subunit J